MSVQICSDTDEALAGVEDGATVLIGGFGMAGMPVPLIDALIRQGARDLTVVSNNAGNGDTGVIRASTSLKAFEKSPATSVRTCCALR